MTDNNNPISSEEHSQPNENPEGQTDSIAAQDGSNDATQKESNDVQGSEVPVEQSESNNADALVASQETTQEQSQSEPTISLSSIS